MVDPVAFFNTQFKRQIESKEFALNPFEQAALPYMKGRVLDMGCGLGNLALEAGRRGCEVLAVDASVAAVERIKRDAAVSSVPVHPVTADLGSYEILENYDTVVSIGLLMFFSRDKAQALLGALQDHVKEGGCGIVNVLIEGTTYLDMFLDGHYTLFGREELEQSFAGWKILLSRHDTFDAPGGKSKVFSTVIARKPFPTLQ